MFSRRSADVIELLTGSLQTKKKKSSRRVGKDSAASKKNDLTSGLGTGVDVNAAATGAAVSKRHQAPQVEEADDE